MFVEYLSEISPSIEHEKVFKAIVIDIWKNNCKSFDGQNQILRKEITELKMKRQRIFELHQNDVYNNNKFISQKTMVSKKSQRRNY